jgi:hypothetical protein
LAEREALLLKAAQAYGWRTELGTAARAAEVIGRHSHGRFHPAHVRKILQRRPKWTRQQPRRRAGERDEAAIGHRRRQELPRIVGRARRRKAHSVFPDGSGFMLTPAVRRTLAPRGKTPTLTSWDRHDRISALSAVTVSPRRRRLGLDFRSLPDDTHAHGEDTVAFLKQLRRHLPGPTTILWDGSNIHDRPRVVRAYLAEHPEIVTEPLPAYGPETDPDEMAWEHTYPDHVRCVLESYRERRGKPTIGEKTPEHTRDVPTILDRFPRAKVIGLRRDGRDAALSIDRSFG